MARPPSPPPLPRSLTVAARAVKPRSSESSSRNALLSQIQKGTRLNKTTTSDRSAPQLTEVGRARINGAVGGFPGRGAATGGALGALGPPPQLGSVLLAEGGIRRLRKTPTGIGPRSPEISSGKVPPRPGAAAVFVERAAPPKTPSLPPPPVPAGVLVTRKESSSKVPSLSPPALPTGQGAPPKLVETAQTSGDVGPRTGGPALPTFTRPPARPSLSSSGVAPQIRRRSDSGSIRSLHDTHEDVRFLGGRGDIKNRSLTDLSSSAAGPGVTNTTNTTTPSASTPGSYSSPSTTSLSLSAITPEDSPIIGGGRFHFRSPEEFPDVPYVTSSPPPEFGRGTGGVGISDSEHDGNRYFQMEAFVRRVEARLASATGKHMVSAENENDGMVDARRNLAKVLRAPAGMTEQHAGASSHPSRPPPAPSPVLRQTAASPPDSAKYAATLPAATVAVTPPSAFRTRSPSLGRHLTVQSTPNASTSAPSRLLAHKPLSPSSPRRTPPPPVPVPSHPKRTSRPAPPPPPRAGHGLGTGKRRPPPPPPVSATGTIAGVGGGTPGPFVPRSGLGGLGSRSRSGSGGGAAARSRPPPPPPPLPPRLPPRRHV